jgi:hypothetical protein
MRSSKHLALSLLGPRRAVCSSSAPLLAYAPLTHEAIIDAAWNDGIAPVLRGTFAGTTEEELRKAHASADGGCAQFKISGTSGGGNEFVTDPRHGRTGGCFRDLIAEAFTSRMDHSV